MPMDVMIKLQKTKDSNKKGVSLHSSVTDLLVGQGQNDWVGKGRASPSHRGPLTPRFPPC